MKCEWTKYLLEDITELVIDHRGKTPKKLGGDWSNVGYRALSAKNIKTGRIVQMDTIRFVCEEMYKKWMKDEIQRGDILITSEAPFGQILFWNSDEKIVLSQRLFGLRIKKEFDPKFIYYYMMTANFQGEMAGRATGTTVIGLRQPELMKCEVYCPKLDTQQKIAAILSSLDDKIELNNKINANLEQQAQALFNEICKNGCSFSLADILEVCYGKDHKLLKDGVVPCYGTGGVMRYVERALYEGESVLIPRKGSLNNVMYVNEAFWTVDTLFYTRMKRSNIAKIVYFFLCKLNLAKLNVGSAVPSMTTAILNAIEITLPDEETCSQFERIVSPIFKKIQHNRAENRCLSETRDTLLQELIGCQTVELNHE